MKIVSFFAAAALVSGSITVGAQEKSEAPTSPPASSEAKKATRAVSQLPEVGVYAVTVAGERNLRHVREITVEKNDGQHISGTITAATRGSSLRGGCEGSEQMSGQISPKGTVILSSRTGVIPGCERDVEMTSTGAGAYEGRIRGPGGGKFTMQKQ